MGPNMLILTTPWPTDVAGRADITDTARNALDSRVGDVADEQLENISTTCFGSDLAVLGQQHPVFPGATDRDKGRSYVITLLHDAIENLPQLEQRSSLSFDGVRWETTIAEEYEGELSEDYIELVALSISQVCEAPVDGPQFRDVAAVAAAVAVLDDLAEAALTAFAKAGLSDEQHASVAAALDAARHDVLGSARTIRKALNAVSPPR